MARIVYTIEFAAGVPEEMAELRAADQKKIRQRIQQQLANQPNVETRNKKILAGLNPPWNHEEPVWELRVGEHRVFYDVNEAEAKVTVRAIREKPPYKTTEEIL
jgi:mRNA-degrading endonuclease RelE of RelBE toxin-antitoxin system